MKLRIKTFFELQHTLLSMRRYLLLFALCFLYTVVYSQLKTYNSSKRASFPLINNQKVPSILIDANDAKVVTIATSMLATDIEMVAGSKPTVLTAIEGEQPVLIIAGTLGQSVWIDKLIEAKKINVTQISGKWESWQTQVVSKPFKGVGNALVIIGSNHRGTAYGLLELSRTMGISPWVWWADVIPEKINKLFIAKGIKVENEPSVKYRGISLDDADARLQTWAATQIDKDLKYIGPKTYARIFELMLRLRSNYCWPGKQSGNNSFYFYPENKKLAADYGIVVGMDFDQPMLRNNVFEWGVNSKNEYGIQSGEWRYDLNQNEIYKNWCNQVSQSANNESVYMLGMGGDNDSKFLGPKNIALKVQLLEKVISDQREILEKVIKTKNVQTPQLFSLDKDAFTLYKKGLNLPEDITILWSDDNHGYIRQLPSAEEQKRRGGHGMYYHLSYSDSPLDYSWLSSISPSLIAYEMNKAYQFGAKKCWMFSVGNIKPTEMEIEFAMDMAWDVTKWTPENAHKYSDHWAKRTFGNQFSKSITAIKDGYLALSQAAKPEHLTKVRFTAEQEALRIKKYNAIALTADSLKSKIPTRLKDAYFQLIWYPVHAAKLMNEKFVYAHQSIELARLRNPSAIEVAAKSTKSFNEILQITDMYNKHTSSGKWAGIMSAQPQNNVVFNMPTIADVQMLEDSTVYIDDSSFPVYTSTVLSLKDDAKIQQTSAESLVVYTGLGANASGITRKSFSGLTYVDDCTKAPYLEFNVKLLKGEARFEVLALPTQPLNAKGGVRYAIGIDDSSPVIVDLSSMPESSVWKKNVVYGYAKAETVFNIANSRNVIVKVYLIEPGVVISQIRVSQKTN